MTPVSIDDYERLAKECLDANAWAYLAGGAGDEITMRWNRAGYDRMAIVPRVLRRFDNGASTKIELFGRNWDHPVFVAPVAYQRLFHRDGEGGTALAAAAQRAGMVLSLQSSTAMEELPAEADTCRWLQLYLFGDKAHSVSLLRRAEACGYEAIVVTVDAPINGIRNREHRAGFKLPGDVSAVHLAGMPAPSTGSGADEGILRGLMAHAATWDDIAWLKSQTRLPLLLKGILSADDAVLAIEHGASGIIVSNHGGRTLDTLPATIAVLPAICARVAGRVPVLVDGGIRRGTDVLKALALGASAVLVGRPIIYGLAVDGARGASHVLRLLRDEFEVAMALSGCRTTREIDPDAIVRL